MKLPRRRHFLHLAAGAAVLPAVRVAWAQLRGDLQALANDRLSAEASFLNAIAIARRQNAKIFELRSAMSLARLWRDQGRRAEAQNLLCPGCSTSQGLSCLSVCASVSVRYCEDMRASYRHGIAHSALTVALLLPRLWN
jgi:hypothetical protein